MRLSLVEDRRRDAAAVVAVVGLVVFLGAPLLLGRICESPVAPLTMVGPALVVAPIVIRNPIRSRFVIASVLWAPLFVLELGASFFFSLDHCGLDLG
jgi:hypothetical protein